jgi:hypothetical protein
MHFGCDFLVLPLDRMYLPVCWKSQRMVSTRVPVTNEVTKPPSCKCSLRPALFLRLIFKLKPTVDRVLGFFHTQISREREKRRVLLDYIRGLEDDKHTLETEVLGPSLKLTRSKSMSFIEDSDREESSTAMEVFMSQLHVRLYQARPTTPPTYRCSTQNEQKQAKASESKRKRKL